MKHKIAIFLVLVSPLCFFVYKTNWPPVYCFSQKRVISDEEFLSLALKTREAEINSFGGIDEYEKYLRENLNRHPESAGRDFDAKTPNCCVVTRGVLSVMEKCKLDSPICVQLRFPKRSDLPEHYIRRGKKYLFDECGNLADRV